MSWTASPSWPPVNGTTDIQDWYWLIKPIRALRERHWVSSGSSDPRYPRYSSGNTWYTGTIDSVTATTITDAAAVGVWDGGGDNPWISGEATVPWAPGSWKIVVEVGDPGWDDPVAVVESQISGIDHLTGTLTVGDMTDYVTSNEILSLASMVGKTFWIIPSYGIWWSDRWPEWPNAQEIDFGTITTSTTTSIYDETIEDRESKFKWQVDPATGIGVMAGKELITTVDGRMVRIAIANHDDAGNMTFAEQTAAPTGDYAIIEPGKRYRLGRRKHMPWAWYRGAGMTPDTTAGAENQHYSHLPDDTLGAVKNPASQITWTDEDPSSGICEEEPHPVGSSAIDWDAWSDPTEECGEGDKPFARDIYKSLRHLQVAIEEFSPSFIESKSYDGEDAIPSFTLATFFKAADINWQQGTISAVTFDGGTGLSTITYTGITLPWDGISGAWAILGKYQGFTGGEIVYYDDTHTFSGNTLTYSGDLTGEGLVGLPFVVSWKWTRFIPREFLRAFPQQILMPDLDPVTGDPMDPNELKGWATYGDAGIGEWIRKDASTHYFEHTGQQPVQSQDELTVGDYVRWSGDNWGDGIVHGGNDSVDAADPLLAYWDRFNVSKHVAETERTTISEQVSGTVTASGSTSRLTDDTKDWYQNVWYGVGMMHTEIGTASAGTNTSLSDNLKTAGTEAGVYWSDRRFVDQGFAGPYVGFIIEVNIDGVYLKRPITTASQDGGGISVTWDEPLPDTANGRAYRIREPKELSRWQGRRLLITFSDGESYETLITHSDDNTLWFEPITRTISAGTSYRIIEPRPGGVWQVAAEEPTDGREWMKVGSHYLVQPLGADAVRTGVATPADFHETQTENLPTIVKRYGRHIRGDYLSRTFYQQIYDGINTLVWTKIDYSWISNGEENSRAIQGSSVTLTPDGDASTAWNTVVYGGTYTAFCGSDHYYGFVEIWNDPSLGDGTFPGNCENASVFEEGPTDDLAPFIDLTTGSVKYATGVNPASSGADGEGAYSYGDASGIPTLLAHAADFYALATIDVADNDEGYIVDDPTGGPDGTPLRHELKFNDFGSGLQFRKYGKWATLSAATTATRTTTSPLGSLIEVGSVSPPEDLGSAGDYSVTEGYRVTNKVLVLKWDVAGGMTYVA